MSIVGRIYLERGEPVEVIAQWQMGRDAQPDVAMMLLPDGDGSWRVVDLKSGPRNVLIQRADGELVVRPFRGLRKP